MVRTYPWGEWCPTDHHWWTGQYRTKGRSRKNSNRSGYWGNGNHLLGYQWNDFNPSSDPFNRVFCRSRCWFTNRTGDGWRCIWIKSGAHQKFGIRGTLTGSVSISLTALNLPWLKWPVGQPKPRESSIFPTITNLIPTSPNCTGIIRASSDREVFLSFQVPK